MMKKAVVLLFIVVVLVGIGTYIAYSKLQQHDQKREQYTQQLIEEQKQLINEQRKKLGHLPDHIPELKPEVKSLVVTRPAPAQKPMSTPLGYFKCDGRERCGQMHSLAEARWFVRNCPNTKMDGNHDGEPCEQDSRRQTDPNWQQ